MKLIGSSDDTNSKTFSLFLFSLAQKDEEIVRRCDEYSKDLRSRGLTEDELARTVFHSILINSAVSLNYDLPFKVSDLKVSSDVQLALSRDSLSSHPYVLDSLYEKLIPSPYRKRLGQFITPPEIAEFMANWGSEKTHKGVLDPAVGTGIFLQNVAKLTDSKIYGIDIDPLLLNACALRLFALGHANRAELQQQDFLTSFYPVRDIDFIICNPPYLNFHDFDGKIISVVGDRLGLNLSKLTNIYSLFFFQSYGLLDENGKMAFITPSEFLYTGYGVELKSFLIANFTIAAFILIDFSKLVFSKALTTSVVTLLQKTKPNLEHKVKFIRMSKWTDTNSLLKLVKGDITELEGCTVTNVPQSELNPAKKWQIYFGENGLSKTMEKLVPLSEVATVNRGIATGANSYFTLTDQEVKKWKIEKKFLARVIARATQAPHYDYTSDDYRLQTKDGDRVFLLYCFEEPSSNLRDYIRFGERKGIHNRYLTIHRKPWYSSEKQKAAPILATVFSREKMRFIFNEASVLSLTAFHCIYPYEENAEAVKALLAYLNSGLCNRVQELMRREYGGGLHKFEPRDLEELLVLDLRKLDEGNIRKLAELFDKLCSAARGSFEQEMTVKDSIDKVLETILKLENKS
jgi:adenine-specific DNA-methyltransferase